MELHAEQRHPWLEAKGVWSSKPRGIDDLIKKLKETKLTSLFIMKQRTFDAKACAQLCEVLRDNESLTYVFFNPHSYSHFFNKIDIHTTYMYKCNSSLYLVISILLHTLTQIIMHTYITLEPQGTLRVESRDRRGRVESRGVDVKGEQDAEEDMYWHE